jgi:hypothetical protein
MAAYFASCDVAKLLLDNGAEVDNKNKQNQTPLHIAVQLAVQNGKTEMVELLIANKADIHSAMEVSIQGTLCFATPVYYALMYNNEALAIVLLQAGATVKANTDIQMRPTLQNTLTRCLASIGAASVLKTNKSPDISDHRTPTKPQNSPIPATSQPTSPPSQSKPQVDSSLSQHSPSSKIEVTAKTRPKYVWLKRATIAMSVTALGCVLYYKYYSRQSENLKTNTIIEPVSPLETTNSSNEDDE